MPKLKDIAEMAGVNISTASRALNGDTEISEETRKKIVEIAQKMGYRKKNRRSLSAKQSKNIGIIIPEVMSNYYTSVANHIHQKLLQENYECFLGITDFNKERMLNLLQSYNNSDLAGIICVMDECEGNLSNEVRDQLAKMNMQVVFIASNNQKISDFDMVWVDEFNAAKKAINYLIDMGHKDIGFIGEHRIDLREKAYTAQLKERNIEPKRSYIFTGNERFELGGYLRMKELLSQKSIPTAVFVGYDQMVIGGMLALKETGLKVPDDISIISFDDIGAASYIFGGLTTIANPVNEMTSVVIGILLSKIKNHKSTIIQNVSLQPNVIERSSVRQLNQT